MEFASVFDFLKKDEGFFDIYRDCLSMEKQMSYELFDMSYVKGRTICEKLIKKIAKNNSNLSYLFSRKKRDGKPYIPGLAETLGACRDKKIISKNISKKYYEIKKVGDAGAHGDNIAQYNLNYCKKIHKMVFDITLHGYNEFNYPIDVPYVYRLDENDKIENTSDDRKEELNNLYINEISTENLKEYFEVKKIFLTKDSFKRCVLGYISNKNEFYSDLEKISFVDDENIDDILSNFDEDERTKIKSDVEKLSQEKSEKIIETLNELSADLTFEEIDDLILSSKDDEEQEIYSFIKALSIDLLEKFLTRIKEELETVPVSFIDENGRKVSKHEKYNIENDEKGFFLKICLDDEQKSAVMYNENKPLVVNAGPGSGKTRILVERIVYLIKDCCLDPSTVLVITFTIKSANELKTRLINDTDLSGDEVNQIRITTIHSFCKYLLAKYSSMPYNILGPEEQYFFVSKFKEELGFKNYAFLYDGWIPRVLDAYDEFFNFNVDINGLIDYIESLMIENCNDIQYHKFIDEYHEKYGDEKFPSLKFISSQGFKREYLYHIFLNIAYSYPKYKELLEMNNYSDLNHLLENAYEILKSNVLNRRSFPNKNILIDEFQDIDFYQMNIFKILQEFCVNNEGSFTIVGDSDQSIYGWRGSTPLFFENCISNPNFNVITIHNNYRSSANIVKFNEELINDYRLIKKDSVPVKSDGNPVFYLSSLEIEEPNNIIQLIKNLKDTKKIKFYSDVALLFRTNRSIFKFIEAFEDFGMPYYTKTKLQDFLDQNEVKSILTLFWLLMPYQKNKFIYRSDDFLNLSWLCDDFFGLSKETKDILINIQNNFEKEAIKLAHEASRLSHKKYGKISKYSRIFYQDEMIVNYVFDNIETYDLVLLEVADLIKLGITNLKDLEFFSKLKNLKIIMWDDNVSYSKKPDLLGIFNSLLNITDYFELVSLRNDVNSKKIKDNLALFSKIIYDYADMSGSKNYLGLFDYLNNVLDRYSCPRTDANEKFDKVHLMTMHMAKGLEYPVVIVCSLKNEFLPNRVMNRNIFSIPNHLMRNKPVHAEKTHGEEMRLIYVASSRARDLLIFSSISENKQLPVFLESLVSRDVKIESLNPYNLTNVQEISSSIINETENVKILKLEEIISNYLFCPYKYDILNNTSFFVSMINQKHVSFLLRNALISIHYGKQDDETVNEKIHSIIKYDYVLPDEIKNSMISNVKTYWRDYGKNYNVLKSNVFLRKQMKNYEIKGNVDLIVKESDDEISIVQFIDSDNKINDFIDEYMEYLYFYTSIIKTYDELKPYNFKNIILHSIDNNKKHTIPYQSNFEDGILDKLEEIANNIVEEKFDKKGYRCINCEFKGIYC